MQPGETTLHRANNLTDALRVLESHPDFPRVQVRMRDRLREAERKAPAEARGYGSRARLEYVLQLFDIRSEAFLELVSDIRMQNAYVVVLESFVFVAWEEFGGRPLEVVRLPSDQTEANLQSIHAGVQRWVGEGYKRLELLGRAAELRPEGQAAPQATLESAAQPSPGGVMNACDGDLSDRRAVVNTMANSPEPPVVASPSHPKRYPRTALQPTRWEDIQICFLSEFKLEIRTSEGEFEAWNYGELGFEDRRNGNPNLVWQLFRSLAESGGAIRELGNLARTWQILEKRIQRLRKFLRHYFNLPVDPLPFAQANGYRARFAIHCSPAYKT